MSVVRLLNNSYQPTVSDQEFADSRPASNTEQSLTNAKCRDTESLELVDVYILLLS